MHRILANAFVIAIALAGAHAAAAADAAPAQTFHDCPACPRMRLIPAGSFEMGSAVEDSDERPPHRVRILKPIAVGVYEVTRAEFEAFVAGTGYDTGSECHVFTGGGWGPKKGITWRHPGFAQTAQHPVVCVSWNDAQAFVTWLSRISGRRYRLLSEAEWEYVARAGRGAERVTHDEANFGAKICCGPTIQGRDRWLYTAPVGSFAAGARGLYDLQGNVWEWVEDCYNEDYAGAPSDAAARTSGCTHPERRMLRGGGWGDDASFLRPGYRLRALTGSRYFTLGFRVAREVE